MEDNFLLESIAACPGKQSDLIMYFTVNTAFMHYFDSLTNDLEVHIFQYWTMHECVLTISLQTSDFDSKLLEAPKTLKYFVYQFKQNKQLLDKCENNNKMGEHSFFDNYIMDVFLFISSHPIKDSHSSNCVYSVQACKTESLGNRHCFSANKRKRYDI